MKHQLIKVLFVTSVATLAGRAAAESVKAPATVQKKEISEDEAKTIAMKLVQGKLLEVEKEKHKGQQVYSVEIRAADGVHEVIINAATGAVIEDKAKDHDDDDDEK